MRALFRSQNQIKLKIETPDDLWHLEKIIHSGDLVSGRTTRKFETEARAERKPVFITLAAEKTEFRENIFRVLGTIKSGKPLEFIQLGAHHSLDFCIGDIISIEKTEWKKYELDRIREAERAAQLPKLNVLIMDERDAELFQIKEYGIAALGSVSTGGGKYAAAPAKEKYYAEILELVKTTDFDKLIIAGPGFEPPSFAKFAAEKIKKKITVESTGNTGKRGVVELINKGAVDRVLQSSRLAAEIKLIEKLIAALAKNRAAYGMAEVKKAVSYGAAETLLVLDSYLFENRAAVEPLLDAAEKIGAQIVVISKENEESKKLAGLGNIAALLRFQIAAE